MGKDHRGHPSGVNKSDDDTGIPAGGKFVEDPKRMPWLIVAGKLIVL